MEDIVVTARKRSQGEFSQDVPISLTAVSGDQIDAFKDINLTDVGNRIPNVRLDDSGVFPGVASYSVRGMGVFSTISSVEPSVGVFYDGIYLGVNLGGAPDTFDLESIEVLRGPQGTLFGRNVTGGAVVMRSRRPSGENGGILRAGIGNNGRLNLSATAEANLTPTLNGKIYVQHSERDGDYRNTIDGRRIGEEEKLFVRPILRWQPTETTDITAIVEHGQNKGDGQISRILNDPETLTYELGVREPSGIDKLSHNFDGKTDIEWSQAVLEANFEVGRGTVTSITGYREVDYASSGDGDGTELEFSSAYNATDQKQFSQELRYASTLFDDRLNYTAGLYYFQQNQDQKYWLHFFDTLATRPSGELDHKVASAFVHGDFELVPDLYLTAGLRYTWERKDVKAARGPNECDEFFNCSYSFRDDKSWSDFTPKVGLSWHITPDTMAYASWTKGFRSGGYNTRVTGANESPGPYEPETVHAYEIGVKSDFLNQRARINLSAFINKYDDLQRTILDPVTVTNRISNAAEATIKGVELEFSALATDNLSFTASVGYLDSEYDRFDGLDVDRDGVPDPELAKGLRLIAAPEWTWSLSALHDLSLGDAGSLTTRVSYSHSAKSTMDDANSRFLDSFNLLDANITWDLGYVEGLSVLLWGKNLTNEKYARTGATTDFFTTVYQNLPRTYGAELIYRF